MSNKTDPLARSVHGANPQFLVGQIIRKRVYAHQYWKEHCFGLSAESIVDKAVSLQYVGGVYGGNYKATPFLCLLLKLLQIGPDPEIIDEYLDTSDFKYLQTLAATYIRLTGRPARIYQKLEELLNDNRKLVYRETSGKFVVMHMDEFIDALLTRSTFMNIDLPVLAPRHLLEESPYIKLAPRISLVQETFDQMKEENKLDQIQLPQTSVWIMRD